MRHWAAVVALCAAAAAGAFAQTPVPQPRVLHEMHGARINQIRATPDYRRLVTVSQDKTVRVWRASDLTLMRTIAVPSEPGEEGSLRSLAITPDGREAIVGGWTGLGWTEGRRSQAYRVELATGRIVQVLRGFPGIIESMAISADGTRLALGLGGGAGLRVLELPSGRELWADREYGERVGFADFAADGRLATTSADGCLRLYDPAGRLSFRAEYPPRADGGGACRGSELGGVRFAPDGRSLAFGLQDRVELVVFDLVRMAISQRLRVDDPEQRSLCCPNWSPDGRQLHMHGAHGGDGPTPLYRVTLASGRIERLASGPQRFTNVLPLPDGDLLVSTIAPSLARLAGDGRVRVEVQPPNGDFRFAWDAWRLDANAERIVLPMEPGGGERRRLALAAPPDEVYRAARDGDVAGLGPPRRDGALRVDAVLDEYGYKFPATVNGRRLQLKPYQPVRSWSGDDRRVVLGTQWSVLMADAQGRAVWEQDLPAPAYQVALSANGRWVLAAVGDGTLRWYDADTGAEALGAFLHRNGVDWIVWRPDGLYASSPGGDEYLAWTVNRGDAREPLLLRAVQFERSLYRPEVLRTALRADRRPDLARPEPGGALELVAPEVRIEAVSEDRRSLRFSVAPVAGELREIGVYADGIPIMDTQLRAAVAGGARSLTVQIPPGVPMNRLRVEALVDRALGIDETAVLNPEPARATGGRLWVLAIGVAEFDEFRACRAARNCALDVQPLPNAPNDAAELARVLGEQGRGLYRERRVKVLANGRGQVPTKAAILAGLRELAAAGPEDTVVVFLASHGFAADQRSEYYFLPADAGSNALLKVTGDDSPAVRGDSLRSLLSASELNDALRAVAGRRFLIMDTCHSGAVGFSSNPFAVAKRSASARYAMFTASTGEEQSYEHPSRAIAHGAFTYALLQALSTAGGPLTLQDAYLRTLPGVALALEQLNAAAVGRNPSAPRPTQTPTLVAPESLRRSILFDPRAAQLHP